MPSAWAMLEVVEDFKGPLDTRQWHIPEEAASSVSIQNGKLILSSSPSREESLTWQYYPRREKADRPAFGAFTALLDVSSTGPAGFQFSLTSIRGRALGQLTMECHPGQPPIVFSNINQIRQESPSTILFPSSGKAVVEWMIEGNTVTARLHHEGKITALATWTGEWPSLVNCTITQLPSAEPSRTIIDSLRIVPLPPYIGKLEILPRHGTPLPGDSTLSGDLADFGGEVNGGYLWAKEETAALPARISNLTRDEQKYRVRLRIRNLENVLISETVHDVTVPAAASSSLTLPLFHNSYGFFIAETQLQNKDGTPLDAPLFTNYAITAAVPAKELPDENGLGVHYNALALLGAKWVRFWDNRSPLLWSKLEPEKGNWQWAKADIFVNRTLAAGMRPLIVLGTTPEWASSDTSYSNFLGKGSYSPPVDIENWTTYCREVARRYKGRINHFEIWNEPNNNRLSNRGFFFYGPPEAYVKLLRAAYTAIKKENPDAVILAPSGTGHFFPFLQRILELGAGDSFDVLSIHAYSTPFPPEIGYQMSKEKDYAYRVQTSRQILTAAGLVKPIWNTEVGYTDGPTLAGRFLDSEEIASEADAALWPNWKAGWPFRPADARRSAAFRIRYFLMSQELGVQKIFFHNRLIEESDGEPVIAAPGLAFVSKILTGASYDQSFNWHPHVKALGFKLPDGRYLIAFWRIEAEDLKMNGEKKSTESIDTAPVDWGNEQRGLKGNSSAKSNLSRSYFNPNRHVPEHLLLSNEIPGYDVFGNTISPLDKWPISENPTYLIFKESPVRNTIQVFEGPSPIENRADIDMLFGKGTWKSGGTEIDRLPVKVTDLYPAAIPLPLSQFRVIEGRALSGSEISLGSAKILLPGNAPLRGRLLLSVRSGHKPSDRFIISYSLLHDNGERERMSPWPATFIKEIGRGKDWTIMRGEVISEPISLVGGEITIQASSDSGRIYAAWWIPE